MLVVMGVCWKTAMSPGQKKKLCKIRRKFYGEQCHVGFFAERFVRGEGTALKKVGEKSVRG